MRLYSFSNICGLSFLLLRGIRELFSVRFAKTIPSPLLLIFVPASIRTELFLSLKLRFNSLRIPYPDSLREILSTLNNIRIIVGEGFQSFWQRYPARMDDFKVWNHCFNRLAPARQIKGSFPRRKNVERCSFLIRYRVSNIVVLQPIFGV
jgi:hypothetical protein